MRSTNRLSTSFVLWLSLALISAATARAAGLKTIDNPKGGRIMYGQVEGQTTEVGAITSILRNLHSQYGDRPQVGRLFAARGTQSVAVFFTLTRRTQDNGKVAGLIIVAKATTEHVEAALLTDDAKRFASTLGPLTQMLFAAWHPLEAAHTSGGGRSAPAAPLRNVVLRDQSAAVGVPEGWRVVPSSANGTVDVVGPRGEYVGLNETLVAFDTNNPWVRQQQRNPSRLYYSFGSDLARDFPGFYERFRKAWGVRPAELQISHAERVQGFQGRPCAHVSGQMDGQDGKGVQEINAMLCTTSPSQAGNFLVLLSYGLVPKALADQERATVGAMLASFQVNRAVTGRLAAAFAAPEIAAIETIGRVADIRRAATLERNEIQNSSFYKKWDDDDKRSAGFRNYQLGYSVVRDIENPDDHATLWNEHANPLVQAFPDRFEYVANPDLIRGKDF